MKVIVNIILLLLISISLFIFPLNVNLLNFDNLNEEEEKITEEDTDDSHYVFTNVTEKDRILYNPEFFEIAIDSDKYFSSAADKDIKYILNLYATNGMKYQFTEADFEAETEVKEKKLKVKIPMNKTALKLSNTGYKANIDLMFKTQSHKISFDVFYKKEDIKLQNRENADLLELTPVCYYDIKREFKLPIYRTYINNSHQFANIIYSAVEGEDKLKNYSLEAWKINLDESRPRVWYSDGILGLNFITSNLSKIKNAEHLKRSLECLSYSLAMGDTGYLVNEVAYSLVDQEEQSYLGYSLVKPFSIDKSPKIYLPLFYNEDSYFWVYVDFESTHSLNDDVGIILDAYAGSHAKFKDERLIALLPPKKLVNKINLMDKVLYLDFDGETIKFFDNNSNYAAMFIEGLLLSLTSLEQVDEVEFVSGGKELGSLGGIPLFRKMQPPTIINILQ